MRLAAELRDCLTAFDVESAESFIWRGRRHTVSSPAGGSRGTHSELSPAALDRLAEVLYTDLHCRISTEGWVSGVYGDPERERSFLRLLSASNSGTGRWLGGWTVRRVTGGGVVHAEKLGVVFEVQPGQYRVTGELAEGHAIMVRAPHEYRNLVPGFYMALGDADDTMTAAETVRIYWNVRADAAARLMQSLTRDLNSMGIAFWLKMVRAPERYHRADAAVLYLHRSQLSMAFPAIDRSHGLIRDRLRPVTSLFALRLGRGLAAAADPGGELSFGQHRARVLAEALAAPDWRAVRSLDGLLDVLGRAGIDPEAPHGLSGSAASLGIEAADAS